MLCLGNYYYFLYLCFHRGQAFFDAIIGTKNNIRASSKDELVANFDLFFKKCTDYRVTNSKWTYVELDFMREKKKATAGFGQGDNLDPDDLAQVAGHMQISTRGTDVCG